MVIFHDLFSVSAVISPTLSVELFVQSHSLLEFFTLPFFFALFCFSPFAKFLPKTCPPHTFPKQTTVLSCSSPQMPVTTQSPMVCEREVFCPAPFLSQRVHGAVKVTVTSDGFKTRKNVSQSLDLVFEDVCTSIALPLSIVSVCVCFFSFCFWKCVCHQSRHELFCGNSCALHPSCPFVSNLPSPSRRKTTRWSCGEQSEQR